MSEQVFAADRYGKMPYRRCGRSGLVLPAISVGFWQSLGDSGNEDICRQVMYHAFDSGITHFDVANNYGCPRGHSESVVGRVLRDMPRDELIIATKAGYDMWEGPYGDGGSRKYLIASLNQSLKRLGLDYVDIFYHHRPDPDTPIEETLGALEQIVRSGKALYAGVSNYRGTQFEQAYQSQVAAAAPPIVIHQAYYHMLAAGVDQDLLPYTAMAGTGVIAFCPLAGGILTDRYLNGLPPDSRQGRAGDEGKKWYESHKAKGTWRVVGELNNIAQARGQTLAQMALTWILRDPRVTSALIGVSSVDQLKQALPAATATPLSAEELAKIAQVTKDYSWR
jgi:L-glyceraldehyde 3-phosphate reductase